MCSPVPDVFADHRKISKVNEELEALGKEAKDGAGIWGQVYSFQAQFFLCNIRIQLIHGRKDKLLRALTACVISPGRQSGGKMGKDRKHSYYFCSQAQEIDVHKLQCFADLVGCVNVRELEAREGS